MYKQSFNGRFNTRNISHVLSFLQHSQLIKTDDAILNGLK